MDNNPERKVFIMRDVYLVYSITRTKLKTGEFVKDGEYLLGVYERKESAVLRAKKWGEFLIRHENLDTSRNCGTSLNDFDNFDLCGMVILGQRDVDDDDGEYLFTDEYRIEIQHSNLFEGDEV